MSERAAGAARSERIRATDALPEPFYHWRPHPWHGLGTGRGDRDPLDICVVSERHISRAEVVLNARVIGGIQMIDGGEADDKIIAVLEKDTLWATVDNVEEHPPVLVERLRHYFGTCKMVTGQE